MTNAKYLKEWRHRKGISKTYNSRTTGIAKTRKPYQYQYTNALHRDKNGNVYESRRIYQRTWRKENREKANAHLHVCRAVKKGILVRSPCWCGVVDVHAHHHNGYENALTVMWLCPKHHKEIHGQKGR